MEKETLETPYRSPEDVRGTSVGCQLPRGVASSKFSKYHTFVREDLVAARDEHVRRFRDAKIPLYPTWSGRTHTAALIHEHITELIGQQDRVTIAGRLMARRTHGGSTFLDVHDGSGKVQVLFQENVLGAERYQLLAALDRGDILAVSGSAMKTASGEDTVAASDWALLTKSLLPLPDTWAGLQDVEIRARQRELDLLMNTETQEVFRARSVIIKTLREFLAAHGFTEVETPILQHIPGGASARPFITHHNALDLDLYLRVSPELYLKRLIVGGMERVFEIARNFRNEGVDRQHNPEFTMCEFYMAYATVEDLVPLTEQLFTTVLERVCGHQTRTYQGKTLDFTPPWKRVPFVAMVKETTGIDALTEERPEPYVRYLTQQGIRTPETDTVPSLLDTLYKEVIRKQSWDPVLVTDFPTIMEPLAKRQEGNSKLVQRIQLLAAGMELLKCYTELNDPVDQEQRLQEQERLRERGDEEAQRIDEAFLRALRIGLPPTAGWGLGVDRLTMLLTDSAHIRDVIAFPLLRPEHQP